MRRASAMAPRRKANDAACRLGPVRRLVAGPPSSSLSSVPSKLPGRHCQYYRGVIAGSDIGKHLAVRCARGTRPGGKKVVEAPTDIALAHVAPGRPPCE